MKRILKIAALSLLFIASAAMADEVRIATGHTFIRRVFDPIKGPFMEKTGIDIHIVFNDPVPALAELEKGAVDVAGASMAITEWLELARKSGVPVKEAAAYTSYVPVTEKTMITVNKENNVSALSKEQLKGIFTGRIVNWNEVGGNDAPILVVWPSASSGALVIFKTRIMDNEPLTNTVYDVESMGETAAAVGTTAEAIGIVSGTKVPDGLKEVAPAIERPLTLAYKGKPSPSLQKLLDFIKNEGKQYIQ